MTSAGQRPWNRGHLLPLNPREADLTREVTGDFFSDRSSQAGLKLHIDTQRVYLILRLAVKLPRSGREEALIASAEPVSGHAGPRRAGTGAAAPHPGLPSLPLSPPAFPLLSGPAASEGALPSASTTGAGGGFSVLITNYKFLELTSPLPSRSLLREPRVLISVKLAGDSAHSCGRAQCQGHSSPRVKVQTEKSSRCFHQVKSLTETRCSQGRRAGSVQRRCGPSLCGLCSLYVFMTLGLTPSCYLGPTLASNSANFKLKAKTVITLA